MCSAVQPDWCESAQFVSGAHFWPARDESVNRLKELGLRYQKLYYKLFSHYVGPRSLHVTFLINAEKRIVFRT